ncbi:MAG: S8 family serine peptidase [bacterium]
MPSREIMAIVPNDPGYAFQWYLEKIGAESAWDKTTGSKDVVIAFLDSGVYLDHPDLQRNIWVNMDEIGGDGIDNDNNGYIDDVHGWDFASNDNDPNPAFDPVCLDNNGQVKEECYLSINHGTIIAGVASALGNNNSGIAGVSWNSKIMPLRVLNGNGYGDSVGVIKAINYAVANGADIINLSLVGDEYSPDLEKIIQLAYDNGLILVAAAGNDKNGGKNMSKYPQYPICYSGKNGENIIIGVAGSDQDDKKAEFSNYGSCVDIVAPAVDFYSTSVFNPKYKGFEAYYSGLWSGTSLATPLVSGLAALIKTLKPSLSNKNITDVIINNEDSINEQYFGSVGRIDMAKALAVGASNIISSADVYVLAAGEKNNSSQIRIFRNDGVFLKSFLAFSGDYIGGVNIAAGDVDGDGVQEVVVAKRDGDSKVRIYDFSGNLEYEFFAYGDSFKGGVNLTLGDLDGNRVDEIIAGTGKGGGPQIRVFNNKGRILSQFFAYSESFHGGVNVTAADIDGNGISEIIAGAGKGGRSQIRVFDKDGNAKNNFLAYPENFFGGVNVSAGDINGDGKDEIITAPLSGGDPHIKIFNKYGELVSHFFAYEDNFHGGVNIATADANNDGAAKIISGKGNGGVPEVKIFDYLGNKKNSFYAFEQSFRGGVEVSRILIK